MGYPFAPAAIVINPLHGCGVVGHAGFVQVPQTFGVCCQGICAFGYGTIALRGGSITLGYHPRRKCSSDPRDQNETCGDGRRESLVALDEKRDLLPCAGVFGARGKAALVSRKVSLKGGDRVGD